MALVEGDRSVDHDERLVPVELREDPERVRPAAVSGGSGVAGGQDAPVHRSQVGCEDDLGADGLLDLGGVTVIEQAVGGEILVDRVEVGVRLGCPACSGNPAGGVDHDPRGFDERRP